MNDILQPIPGWRPSTPEVTGVDVDAVIKSFPAVVVHFWAPWNGSDPPMDCELQKVREHFGDRVHFVSCNVDLEENLKFCWRCNVWNVPFLAVFIGGEQRRSIIGLRTADELIEELELRVEGRDRAPSWWKFWRPA
jgi:hypothetical protein